jgi:hypothetical protein
MEPLFGTLLLLAAVIQAAQGGKKRARLEGYDALDWHDQSSWLVARDVPDPVLRSIDALLNAGPLPPTYSGMRLDTPGLRRWGGSFWELDLGGYVIRAEPWCESCLSEGYGPWSSRRYLDDAEWPAGDLEERLGQYEAEGALRRETLRPPNPDAAPAGAEMLWRAWVPVQHGMGYDAMELVLWEKA